MIRALAIAIAAAVIAERVAPRATRFALRVGCVANPNPDVPSHTRVVPLLGGVAVASAVLPAIAIAGAFDPCWLGMLGAALIVGALGAYKDRVERPVSPAVQLAVQAAAAIILWASGFDLGLAGARGAVAMIALTIAVLNAWNFLDVLDGLFATVAAASALAFLGSGVAPAIVAAAVVGAHLGYLRHNWPPACMFLGDVGSFVAGIVFTALVADAVATRGSPAPLLALAVPLLDLAATIGVRIARGRPPWRGGPEHLPLALARRGVDPRAIAIGAGAIALCAGRFAM